MPRNLGDELKDKRSRPTNVLDGSERMTRVEVMILILMRAIEKVAEEGFTG